MLAYSLIIITYEVELYFKTSIYFRRYSRAEQKEIVECVMRHGAYGLLKGTTFWKMMEEKMVKKVHLININLKVTYILALWSSKNLGLLYTRYLLAY
jgi:hypothetical protein